MADPDKIPETQSDTQATYDATAENVTQQVGTMNRSSLGESQDFQLVDCDETQKEAEDGAVPGKEAEESVGDKMDHEKMNQESEKQVELKLSVDSRAEGDKEEITKEGEVKSTTEDKEKFETVENKEEKMEINEEKELCEQEDEDDDVDFIQSSQAETCSPLKKQLSSLSSLTSQKRKAESPDDETWAKYPRTCSEKGALSNVRKRLNEETNDIFTDENKDQDDDEIMSNMIIQETPESTESCESLQQVEQALEETLSQNLIEDEDEKVKDCEKTDGTSEVEECHKNKEQIEKKKEVATDEKPEKSTEEVHESTPKAAELLESKKLSIDAKVNDAIQKNDKEASKTDEDSTRTEETKGKSSLDEVMSTTKTEDNSRAIDSCFVAPTSSNRSRMSIEVIYDRATAPPEKKQPRELVEIDEDGEKIVLDSSQESCNKTLEKSFEKNDSSFKTCASTDYKSVESNKDSTSNDHKASVHSLTNGNTESKIVDSDLTTTGRSDLFTTDSNSEKKASIVQSPSKKLRETPVRVLGQPELVSISDSDESFSVDERSKIKEQSLMSSNHDNSTTKTLPVEKELSILVKLKCLVYVDETTKEHVEKIITGVHCESGNSDFSTSRHRNSDNSANLADISGNEKDASPGSVTSNPNPYPLNARLSLASVASTSSTSSAGSLNAKITAIKFQLPRGPAKHAKKINLPEYARPDAEDALEQIKKEWKNVDTVTCTVMNFASQELNNSDQHNGSTLRVDNSIERIRSSTPEVAQKDLNIEAQSITPKRGTKRSRSVPNAAAKTTRAKNLRSSDTNGLEKDSQPPETEKRTPSASRIKRKSSEISSTPSRQSSTKEETIVVNSDDDGELVGKQVFAKWSDNKYYPGTVTGKTKTKFRVNFYDGQNKLIIEDFIVPMPPTLSPGLSVYATSDEDDYGSCGIILEVKNLRNEVVYIVETDDGEKIEVDIKNIFLTNDQVQVLKEEAKIEMKSPPSTPKHLGKITLENVIDGKRRSKRILTPVTTTTPKGKRERSSVADKPVDFAKPSGSGVSNTLSVKFEDDQGTTSDSNISGNEQVPDSIGVQEEINGTPGEQETKGQPSSIKGKGRGRKKSETPEIINNLGPIPPPKSELFKGMSFILSCASIHSLDRFQMSESSSDARDSYSDSGTENEEEWNRKPFVRDRLVAQLTAGGGKVYDTFESIPPEEYVNTKHITNLPNTTRKNLLCLSVGIGSYSHQWVVRSCQENRIVSPSGELLPAGWSILKKSYVEMYQRRMGKPFEALPVIFVIPVTPVNKEFVTFWRKVCENAGGGVLLVENPDDNFVEGTVVLTNQHCPSWVVEKASSWNIPLVSTTWVIECLVQGDLCGDDAHASFKHNILKKSLSHISHLKRRK
ncbi:TP53-binding protein 1-like [Venturia canescens]|uniref:TP53-binding protein 1-like n=1 Tax=Venturia canescens TaxID=32260 RepID=UPI001C9BCC2D|nr:TP53-binding protein 1-like [Venturia canescens]XP_043283660.1 TP53-binding protein 1-like [Venturia canescens]XP_043283661.1 TP53-binding protein 1-like [Venturia canescens]